MKFVNYKYAFVKYLDILEQLKIVFQIARNGKSLCERRCAYDAVVTCRVDCTAACSLSRSWLACFSTSGCARLSSSAVFSRFWRVCSRASLALPFASVNWNMYVIM